MTIPALPHLGEGSELLLSVRRLYAGGVVSLNAQFLGASHVADLVIEGGLMMKLFPLHMD